MPSITTAPSDSAISPITGQLIARHEAAGLKGLTPEQHARFWEEVRHWTTAHFSTAKWNQVLKCIERVNREDHMMVLGCRPRPRPYHSIPTPDGRHLRLYTSSSFTAPTGAHPLRPAYLPRIDTGSPSTPRPRWDVVSAGPVTPLSATSGPIKNAFAEGGHWASLTPRSSAAGTPSATTPVTGALGEQWEPGTCIEAGARAAYKDARSDVSKLALQLCASRHALRRSFSAENDVIHPAMVSPRDTLMAAELTLASYAMAGPVAGHVDEMLPSKLERYADDEAEGLRQYRITKRRMLRDVDAWVNRDENTGELMTILEAQRDLLRMNRERRKGRDIAVGEGGIRLAWATKAVCDIEAEMARKRERDGEDSDDEGYDYGNFLRSLGGRNSAETADERWSGSTLDVSLTNSSTAYSSSRDSDLDTALSQRSSSSLVKPTNAHDTLPLRNRTFTFSNLLAGATSSDPHTHSHVDSYPAEARRPRYSTSYSYSGHSIRRSNVTTGSRPSLSVETSNNSVSSTRQSSLISPQERGTRRQGPSIEDLSSWADELKRMERKRAEMRLGGSGNNTAFANRGNRGRQDVVYEEEEGDLAVDSKDDVAVVDVKDNGLVVNGFMHPALRGGGENEEEQEREEGSNTKSWRCSIATGVEQDGHDEHDKVICASSSNDEEAQIHGSQYEDNYNDDDGDEDVTTPTPEHTRQPSQSLQSSSPPTHPPIKLSSLQTTLAKHRPSRPRRPQRPSSILIPPPNPIIYPSSRYNRHAATSSERQATQPPPDLWAFARSRKGAAQEEESSNDDEEEIYPRFNRSKAVVLEGSTTRSGSGWKRELRTRRSKSRVGERRGREEEREEWDREFRGMESRDRVRQLGALRSHKGGRW